jgi:hypothetical protein
VVGDAASVGHRAGLADVAAPGGDQTVATGYLTVPRSGCC